MIEFYKDYDLFYLHDIALYYFMDLVIITALPMISTASREITIT
jgi:hypothetical protein